MFKKSNNNVYTKTSFGVPMYKEPQKIQEMAPKDVNKKINGYEAIRKKVMDDAFSMPSKASNDKNKNKKQKINIGI